MQQEIECKFLNVDHDVMRRKLKSLGAECIHPMRLMRRVVVDYPDRRIQAENNGWIRIRDEGDKVTLTYKETTEHKFGGAKEIEVIVSDYQKTIDIFLAMGMVVHTDQETKRETWLLDDVEVVLDEWPWLNTFIEIEGSSKVSVKNLSQKLGFKWQDAVFGSVTTAYRMQYPKITNDEHISMIPKIKFGLEKPEWFEKGKIYENN